MNKLIACVAVFSLSAVAAVSGGGNKAAPNINGSWAKDGGIINGKKIPPEIYERDMYVLVFNDGMYSESIMGKETEAGTYTIDATKKPPTIDFNVTAGPENGKFQLGLFKIEGDVLTLALALHGSTNRPKNFNGTGNLVVSVLKRTR